MFEKFPYTNLHELNLDWIIKITKDFLEQYTSIQQVISDGEDALNEIITNGDSSLHEIIATGENSIAQLTATKIQELNAEKNRLEALLQSWYDTHSQVIANQLTTALADMTTHYNGLVADLNALNTQIQAAIQQKGVDTLATIPSDYTALYNDVVNLKSAIDDINEYIEEGTVINPTITVESGFIDGSTGENSQNGNESYKRTADYLDVSKISKINVHPVSGVTFYYAKYNSSKVFISRTTISGGLIDMTGAGYVRLCATKSYGLTVSDFNASYDIEYKPWYIEEKFGEIEELQDNEELINDCILFGSKVSDKSYTEEWTNGFIDENGNQGASSSYMHSNKIAVVEGDQVEVRSEIGGVDERRQMRYVTAYNGSTPVPSASAQNVGTGTVYTVPAGINGVIVTTAGQESDTSYTNRRVYVVSHTAHGWEKKEPIGKWQLTGNLSDGQAFLFPENNVKNQKVMIFSAIISSFSAIKFGRTIDGTYTDWCYFEIDSTNVTFHDVTTNPVTEVTYPHGLTIENTIQIKLATENGLSLSSFIITSNGVSKDMREGHGYNWLGDKGQPFIFSSGSSLTGCVASWTSRNINKPIWFFGDSYMSLYDERWAYYLVDDGYEESCILNAYAGEGSEKAIISLKNLLKIARPQYIVWMMGMNDPDPSSNTKVNDKWKYCYDILIDYCQSMGIKPILATIPNVPTQINKWKNDIVKASGYPYIDQAKAVGAESVDSGWYTGLLSNDGIHPTVAGAKALYYQVLADFPEVVTLSN